jgi:acyl carrier protein
MDRVKIEDLVDSKNIFNLIVAIRKAIAIKIPEPKGGEADPQ